MAAGASPTGGVGGIFYFLLLVVGLARRFYRSSLKDTRAKYIIPPLVLLVALLSVALMNIVFVYRFVSYSPINEGIGVQLNWETPTAVLFSLTLFAMFVLGFLLLRTREGSLRYRLGCGMMVMISGILLLWLPVGILESLRVLRLPF